MGSRRGPGNRAERRLTQPLIGYQAEEDARFDAWAALGLSSPSLARVRSAGGEADGGHAEVDGRLAGSAYGFELLGGGRRGGLDRGDLAHPTLFFGFLQPLDEVGVDCFQPWHLSWVDPQ